MRYIRCELERVVVEPARAFAPRWCVGDGGHRLQCKAYVVRNAGQSVEDEARLANFHSRPY